MRIPFEQAVTEHGATVLRVCRAVLGTPADAEDAWSDTFVAALKAWPDLDPHANTEAWLVRVAQRKAIDIARRRTQPAAPSPTITGEPPDQHSTEGIPGTGEPELWARVAALPTRQREAIAYHYLGGLSHRETAELTDSTPAAVRRAAADGIASLRRAYEGTPASDELRGAR